MKSWTHFSVAVETKRLWRIIFDSPPINLVSPEMLTELPQLVDQMEGASELRVVVFESANPDYFLNHYDTSRVAETPKEARGERLPAADRRQHAPVPPACRLHRENPRASQRCGQRADPGDGHALRQ